MPESNGPGDSRSPRSRPPPAGEHTPGRVDDTGDHHHPSGWRVSPAPDGRGSPPRKPPPMSQMVKRFGIFLLILLGINIWLSTQVSSTPSRIRIPYSPTFVTEVEHNNVSSISSQGETIQGDFRKAVTYPSGSKHSATHFDTQVPTFANNNQLSALLQKHGVTVNAKPISQGGSTILNILLGFGPTLLIFGLIFYFARRASTQSGGGLMGFGRSRARRYEQGTVQRVSFNDVAGIDEAKEELSEIVDFLRSPAKYRRLGGRIPRGVLLAGPPGTGKTLLARAVAGEAGVPFFSMSASEFVEIVVGVGASRVRDLFQQAKEAAPAIIFIDELDAIGRSRAASVGLSGGNDEREQTLNQILTEMDGFDPATGVIVLAATNRAEILDQALLRPGRFDRRVNVQPPDRDGRRKILEVHTRDVPLASDVDLGQIASTTQGMVGADLANLVNEAALLAARRSHDLVTLADFIDAVEKLILGTERRILIGPRDRERTAYHESGHALVGMLTKGADPVRKVSIIPRGPALGVTLSAPEADRFNYDRQYLLGRIKVALGGRVAEEVVYGDITTGAESDIQQLTEIARQMVGRWGMSDAIGPIAVIPSDAQAPWLPGASTPSETTQRLVDEEVRRIVDTAHQQVTELLIQNRDKLDALVRALLEHETLDAAEAYAAADVDRAAPPEEDARVGEVVHRRAT